jgi:hypothetical protein
VNLAINVSTDARSKAKWFAHTFNSKPTLKTDMKTTMADHMGSAAPIDAHAWFDEVKVDKPRRTVLQSVSFAVRRS